MWILSNMHNIVFINNDKKAIRILLKEIGAHTYYTTLENMKVNAKPLTMTGFFLEANQECIFLCYVYPVRVVIKLMKVDRYNNIPKNGWEMKTITN